MAVKPVSPQRPASRRFRIDSVESLLKRLATDEFNVDYMLFRGQAQDWPLLPKLARLALQTGDSVLGVERAMFEDFRRQTGWFTVHASPTGTFVPLERDPVYADWLWTIEVPSEKFSEIRWALDRCSINEASLFADLPALCSYLQWLHSLSPDES
jgi:hypothetical protein